MLRRIALTLVLLFSIPSLAGPLNLRHPALSPDGSKICFSYDGDLWIVPSGGGKAEILTSHVGYDSYPAWSPDGRFIAFSGNRYGNFDVFVLPSTGGQETRVTYNSADDYVSGWTPDNKEVLFDSQRELHNHCVFAINPFDQHPRPLTRIESKQGRLSPDGKKLLFSRGYAPWWRKGYRGGAACDLFVKDMGNGQIGQFTAYDGNDLEGSWMPGGDEIIYLSDSTGSYNIFKKNIRTGAVDQLTLHKLNAAFPRISADGSLICYELGGEIWLYDLRNRVGSKLTVTVAAGDKTNPTEILSFDSGATEMALSPDCMQIAYVVAGEIFCTTADGQYQQQLTHSAADDREISWSSDSRELIFISDQDDGFDVYYVRSTDPNQPSLALSHSREIARLMESDRTESQPSISPDNSKVAFVRSQTELLVTDRRGLNGRKLSEGSRIHDVSWSPDGRYLLFTLVDSDWFKDIYIIDSESGRSVNLTQNPGNYSQPRMSPDGKMLYFIEDGHLFYMFVQRDVSEMTPADRRTYLNSNGNGKSTQPVQIDFENVPGRMVEVPGFDDVTDAITGPGCHYLYFAAPPGNIWIYDIDLGQSELLAQNLDAPCRLQYDSKKDLLYFSDRGGRFYSIDIGNSQLRSHPYHVKVFVDYPAQRVKLLEQVWDLVRERFYDESLHGVDWNQVQANYSERAAAVRDRTDLIDMIREMLGELNSSHLAIWPKQAPGAETAYLGIIPDYDNTGSGIKIGAIVPGSSGDRAISSLQVGEKISEIENNKIKGKEAGYEFLDGVAGEDVMLDIATREGMNRKVLIRPIGRREYEKLEWQMWADGNRQVVDELSKGKVGYIYLRDLDDEALDDFGHQMAAYAEGKDALILDIRDNVGGSAHDRLLELLSNRAYIDRVPRNGLPGEDSRVLFKGPILLLVNGGTSSDAEIFAHGFRQLGLGTIMGTETYGAVLGTETLTLLDGSKFSVPTVGWYSRDGKNLESQGVLPDIIAPMNLTLLEKGEDSQIRQAVEHLTGNVR